VSNVILAWGLERDALEAVNRFWPDGTGLVSVDDDRCPMGWYGGTKMLECHLAIGAFNYLDLEGLRAHLETVPWRYPEDVQLMVKGQWSDRFTVYELAAGEAKDG
jgi:hypothetical protein